MYREIVFIAVVVCLTLFISNLDAMECRIVDEEGNPIYSANAGELVYFKSTYTYTKSKKMTWNLMVTLPTVDLKNYKTSMKHNGYFFHDASLENKSHLIPIAIPKDSFIEGKANFQYKLTSNGNCYVYLNIDQDSEPPTASTLTATAVSTRRIDLSWTACTDNKGVAGYKIHSSNGTPLRTVNVTSTYLPNGKDELQFLFSANKGTDFGLLKKVASGGEMSRIMLAVKAILAQYSKLPTLIFDEIDTGVSGEIAIRMGEIMKEMSQEMQIFAITHLPQIAAKGNAHFKVFKSTIGEDTQSELKLLNNEERVVEIAQMLSGTIVSDSALNHAKALLN